LQLTKSLALNILDFDDAGPMDIKQKRRWLAASINKKTGEFTTLDNLMIVIAIYMLY
jgi:hypothetical protein